MQLGLGQTAMMIMIARDRQKSAYLAFFFIWWLGLFSEYQFPLWQHLSLMYKPVCVCVWEKEEDVFIEPILGKLTKLK